MLTRLFFRTIKAGSENRIVKCPFPYPCRCTLTCKGKLKRKANNIKRNPRFDPREPLHYLFHAK